MVFSAAVDHNGYLPVHNKKYSAPQGDDPVWNNANSRNRRIFDDMTGLLAGRNTKTSLSQTYPRDLGGGRIELIKDISAPIFVRGRALGRVAHGREDRLKRRSRQNRGSAFDRNQARLATPFASRALVLS